MTPYLARRKTDFESPIIRVVLNALRLANARHDREMLRRLCVAWEALTGNLVEMEDVAASATIVGGDFLRAWAELAAPDADENEAEILSRLRSSLVERLDFPGIVDWFLGGPRKPWDDDQDQELQEEVGIWTEFHEQYVREHGAESMAPGI